MNRVNPEAFIDINNHKKCSFLNPEQMEEGFSSPEPLLAISWKQGLLGWRRLAEDGACCLHCEDKVEVGDHHGDARQKGKSKPEPTDAAAEGCRNPINESGNNRKRHVGVSWLPRNRKWEVTKTARVSPSKGKDHCQ